jgi:hypothetical protein
LLISLYVVAFLLEVGGVVFVVAEIAGDIRAVGAVRNIDTLHAFTAERLTGGVWRRLLGIGLILLGAAVGLVANILSAL